MPIPLDRYLAPWRLVDLGGKSTHSGALSTLITGEKRRISVDNCNLARSITVLAFNGTARVAEPLQLTCSLCLASFALLLARSACIALRPRGCTSVDTASFALVASARPLLRPPCA